MMSWMGPKEWKWSFRCLANFNVWVLFLKERFCSSYLKLKSFPVWPMYAFPQ